MITATLLLLSAVANAGGFSEGDHLFALEKYHNPQVGRFTTTVQGINQEMRRFALIGSSYDKVRLPSPQMGTGEIEVRLHAQKGRAPLAIVLPPLYDTDRNYQSTRFIDFFASRGYHVVVVPNTWSTLVTREKPKFFPGDLHAEAAFVQATIDEAVRKIGPALVSGRVLMGTSYGAFLSAMIKALDAVSPQPKISGPVTLLSPPVDLLNSMNNLDLQAAESVAEGGEDCTKPVYLSWFLPRTFLAKSPDDLPDFEKCSKAFLTLVGFRDSLKELVSTLAPDRGAGSPTYEEYAKLIARLPMMEEEADLGYWLHTADTAGFRDWRIISPLDDTINDGRALAEDTRFAADPLEVLAPRVAGHIGFRSSGAGSSPCPEGSDWLDCVLIRIYPKIPSASESPSAPPAPALPQALR